VNGGLDDMKMCDLVPSLKEVQLHGSSVIALICVNVTLGYAVDVKTL
jgi:hypothetical protein